jgi:4-hydroxy-tetrahydrodipicolinate reductase
MTQVIRVWIHGASGRMGQALVRLALVNPLLEVTVTTGRGDTACLHELPEFDVAIDFSSPEGFDAALALCLARTKPLVCGTTGLSQSQFQALKAAGEQIPVLWASNYSLGVAVLNRLVTQAGQWLKHWQLDILESHHIHKKDAPSGTALSLGETARAASGIEPVYHSLRGGDIIGEHTVQFTGTGERIELIHRATDRDIFAQGALYAAEQLAHKSAGHYQFADLL